MKLQVLTWYQSPLNLNKQFESQVLTIVVILPNILKNFIFWGLQPPAGEAITGRGVLICKYPNDPSIVLGYISFAFVAASTVAGYYSLFYPYKEKSIPQAEFFSNCWCSSFFNVAL